MARHNSKQPMTDRRLADNKDVRRFAKQLSKIMKQSHHQLARRELPKNLVKDFDIPYHRVNIDKNEITKAITKQLKILGVVSPNVRYTTLEREKRFSRRATIVHVITVQAGRRS